MIGFYGREALYSFKSTKESSMDENERLAFKMLTTFANNCGYEKIDLVKLEDEVSNYFTFSLVHEIGKDWPQTPADVIDADALKNDPSKYSSSNRDHIIYSVKGNYDELLRILIDKIKCNRALGLTKNMYNPYSEFKYVLIDKGILQTFMFDCALAGYVV